MISDILHMNETTLTLFTPRIIITFTIIKVIGIIILMIF
jgi:hypothetical protein